MRIRSGLEADRASVVAAVDNSAHRTITRGTEEILIL
jgi:hypothetical protein